jgi:hypothetical protein
MNRTGDFSRIRIPKEPILNTIGNYTPPTVNFSFHSPVWYYFLHRQPEALGTGVDPGRINVWTARTLYTDGTLKTHTLSNAYIQSANSGNKRTKDADKRKKKGSRK